MTQQEAKELVRNLLLIASDRQSFFENVSAKDVIEANKLENVDEEVIEEALFWLQSIAELTVAIHSDRDSGKVVEFRPQFYFESEFIDLQDNGEVWGVYYDEDGSLVAELITGEIIKIEA